MIHDACTWIDGELTYAASDQFGLVGFAMIDNFGNEVENLIWREFPDMVVHILGATQCRYNQKKE